MPKVAKIRVRDTVWGPKLATMGLGLRLGYMTQSRVLFGVLVEQLGVLFDAGVRKGSSLDTTFESQR